MAQEGDVLLFQTTDGGEITVEGGIVEMSGGLETAAYLSLFGGNEDDDGLADSPANWWGNLDELDPAKQYHSETQRLLQSTPATSGNLRRIEEAAKNDLAWFLEEKVASAVTVVASIPGLNKLHLAVTIDGGTLEFTENWEAAA